MAERGQNTTISYSALTEQTVMTVSPPSRREWHNNTTIFFQASTAGTLTVYYLQPDGSTLSSMYTAPVSADTLLDVVIPGSIPEMTIKFTPSSQPGTVDVCEVIQS